MSDASGGLEDSISGLHAAPPPTMPPQQPAGVKQAVCLDRGKCSTADVCNGMSSLVPRNGGFLALRRLLHMLPWLLQLVHIFARFLLQGGQLPTENRSPVTEASEQGMLLIKEDVV